MEKAVVWTAGVQSWGSQADICVSQVPEEATDEAHHPFLMGVESPSQPRVRWAFPGAALEGPSICLSLYRLWAVTGVPAKE